MQNIMKRPVLYHVFYTAYTRATRKYKSKRWESYLNNILIIVITKTNFTEQQILVN